MIKILIADDEQYERELLAEILHRHFDPQIQTRTVESGSQAIDVAGFWKPSVILMDIEMPGINGIEAAKRIVERDASVQPDRQPAALVHVISRIKTLLLKQDISQHQIVNLNI